MSKVVASSILMCPAIIGMNNIVYNEVLVATISNKTYSIMNNYIDLNS